MWSISAVSERKFGTFLSAKRQPKRQSNYYPYSWCMLPLEPTSTDQLLSRRAVARRWGVSTETIKRRERAGSLHALKFNSRLTRYRLSEVELIEREAMGG